ncbi:hypothetical protein BT69DRAFT_1295481 [Atractiella rhizophila]|nr:hypothetical protein BT69DRAFT_1295481 [Atractiella rhizophila]
MLLGLKAISKPEQSLSSPKASGSGSGIQDEGNHEDEQKEYEEDTAALATAKERKGKGLAIISKLGGLYRRCKLMVKQKSENMDDLGNLFMFKQVQDTFGGSLQTRLWDKQWQYNSDYLLELDSMLLILTFE